MIITTLLALALAQPGQAAPPEVDAEEIVIVARPGKCRVQLADRALSSRQLAAHAARWAAQGIPVRVIRPRGADYSCMAKIAFRLGEHGVRLIQFVDRGDRF